jgi:NitT/TauT family transport system substrate-binding protein
MKFKKLFLFLAAVVGLAAFTSCDKKDISFDNETVQACSIAAPKGAPAISVAALANVTDAKYDFVAATNISSELAKATAKADFVIAPINAGAKLYKLGKSEYKLAAVVTWGNLYFASQKENFSLIDIKDSTVTFFGQNSINASIASYVLNEKGYAPAYIEYVAEATDAQTVLVSDANPIVLCAEPAISAAKLKKPNITSISVQALYKELTGNDGFTQAGLFVNPKAISEKKDVVDKYILEVSKSIEKCSSSLDEVAQICVDLKLLPNLNVAKAAIPLCSVKFMKATEAKTQIETTANIDLSQFGGALPVEEFYYQF